jgi:hypothetical protein
LLIATPKADDRQIPFNSSQAKQKRAGCAMSFLMAVQCGKLFVPASTCMIFAFLVILQDDAMKTLAQFTEAGLLVPRLVGLLVRPCSGNSFRQAASGPTSASTGILKNLFPALTPRETAALDFRMCEMHGKC